VAAVGDHILDLIDGAIASTVSADAMRWSPDPTWDETPLGRLLSPRELMALAVALERWHSEGLGAMFVFRPTDNDD
jgi:hypothetical protein